MRQLDRLPSVSEKENMLRGILLPKIKNRDELLAALSETNHIPSSAGRYLYHCICTNKESVRIPL
ncbi:hypothetical protein HMPREF3039_00934 [Akkermansia sp. KLE1798]|nr:hypothetical protein HMPREF3039_00934 [Akkermansia sp. KLE1798]KZA06176.1 hypothetical protein HMPREF1326_00024 [Akkermansia sp. KLE1605]